MKRTKLAVLAALIAACVVGWTLMHPSTAQAGRCYGFRPLPPPMCSVVCICDRNGLNCSWQVTC